jgi:hypothetical protein
MELRKYLTLKNILSVLAGAFLGYGYYYFVGCRTGSCPISGNPFISTLYGAMMGIIFILPSKKKKGKGNESNN